MFEYNNIHVILCVLFRKYCLLLHKYILVYDNITVQLSRKNTRFQYKLIKKGARAAEVDFIIQRGGKIIPIEVKSADNTKAKSLKVYMDTHKPEYAIKLSAKNFGFEDHKKTVPLYACFCC